MNDTRKSDWIPRLPWIAFTLLLVLLGTYLVAFKGKFGDSQVWGQLGDFVGGTLNPLLAFVTLLVLLQTWREQRRQIQLASQQSVVEELQRLLASISSLLDAELRQPLRVHSALRGLDTTEWVLQQRQLMHEAGAVHHASTFPETLEHGVEHLYSVLLWRFPTEKRYQIVTELAPLRKNLQHLDWVLRRFLANGGAPDIATFYGIKFESVAVATAIVSSNYEEYGSSQIALLGLTEPFETRVKHRPSGE